MNKSQEANLEAIRLLEKYCESGGKSICPYRSLTGVKYWLEIEEKKMTEQQKMDQEGKGWVKRMTKKK